MVGVACVLSACGGGDDATNGTEVSVRTAATPAVDAENVTPARLAAIPRMREAAGARADVRIGRCPLAPGAVTVSGTVRNPERSARDYAITVSWVNDRADVRGRAVATVRGLEPGGTRRWRATTRLTARNATACTLYVQRGRLAR